MADAIRENNPELAPPLDQVFGMLQRDYSRSTIEREVKDLLKLARNAHSRNHESILKLSVDSAGRPFVVTTNFDLMFEKVDRRLHKWSAPQLPSMVFNESPSGIVYLHGRLARLQEEGGSLVLSSGDFGRAYLADGWATEFMRDLLERRVVVLLGYSAGDPPVRYLLEGLSASSSPKLRSIYAFDRGQTEDVRAKWSELGVVGIGFEQFPQLWSSLEAWANRAKDKKKWVAQVISMARSSPRDLLPYQRGQVAALVATTDGAKAFAESTPPPTSEWLCVFDKHSRFGPIEKARPQIRLRDADPQCEYGLDDDPARVVKGDSGLIQDGLDLLSTLPLDALEPTHSRISNMANGAVPLNARLRWLVQWFGRVLDETTAFWWSIRQRQLHPSIIDVIGLQLFNREVGMSPLDGETRRVWSVFYEAQTYSDKRSNGLGWVKLQVRIRSEGWTSSVLRELQDIAQPYLAPRPSVFNSALPPTADESVEIRRLVRFDVETRSRKGADVDVPDDLIRPVVRIMREVLERAITLLDDAQGSSKCYRAPAIQPELRGNSQPYKPDGLAADFVWFVELCQRLRKLSPSLLQEEVNVWPFNDGYFFSRLCMHFWKERDIFDGPAVGQKVGKFSDDVFCNPYVQRELLHLLRQRWNDFSDMQRRRIQRRILNGRDRYDGESAKEYSRSKRYHAGITLGWLQRNGCRLSSSAGKALTRIRGAKDWPEAHELGADHDWDGRTGWVEQRDDARDLCDLPTGEIVSRALELSNVRRDDFVEERPFAGLVERNTRRAFLALTIERRKGNCPTFLWRQLISSWPDETSERLLLACANRLADLPTEMMFNLRFDVTRWVLRFAPRIFRITRRGFWSVWDRVFDCLFEIGEDAAGSAISSSTDSKGNPRSTKTVDHAINGPIGHLVEALFAIIAEKKFKKGARFSPDFCSRWQRTLRAPGEGASHAAILLGRRLNFLYAVDGLWFDEAIQPHLAVEDPLCESFWAGVIAEMHVPVPVTLFKALKPSFMTILQQPAMFHFDEGADRNLPQMLIQATFWSVATPGFISLKECREALRTCSESGRHAALWWVEQIVSGEGNWTSFGKSFFKSAWPREVVYRTSATAEAMVRVATRLRDRFEEVVGSIHEYLTFVDYPDTVIFGLLDTRHGTSIATDWPSPTLAVLAKTIRPDASRMPFQLGTVLDAVAEADESLRTRKAWRDLADLLSG